MTDLGRVSTPILLLPEKMGHNGEPDRLPDETQSERACSSPTHVLVAIATRNNAFLVLLREEASAKAQKGGPVV